SRLLSILGGRFSHFRKQNSEFSKRDDGEVYELQCEAKDEISGGRFRGYVDSISKEKPPTTCFADIDEATDFVFQLDGSCGYSYPSNRLSFMQIEFPKWDLYFCGKSEYSFNLLNYLFDAYDLKPEFDCVLFMQKIPQVWGHSWLYKPDNADKIAQPTAVER